MSTKRLRLFIVGCSWALLAVTVNVAAYNLARYLSPEGHLMQSPIEIFVSPVSIIFAIYGFINMLEAVYPVDSFARKETKA